MNVLVTGGAGFIGSHVVDLLAGLGHRVLVVDNLITGRMENLGAKRENVMFEDTDISYPFAHPFVDADAALFEPEVILHLAAQASITVSNENPKFDLQTNGLGTLNVIMIAKQLGVRRIVMASTSAVYGDEDVLLRESNVPSPMSPYGVSKLAGENYLRAMFPESVILRLGNVYGPRQVSIGENQVMARMIGHVLHGKDFSIHGDGNQKRDFVYVEDVAKAFHVGMVAEPGIYNIASGRGVSVNGVAAVLARVMGQDVKWAHDEIKDTRRNVRMDVSKARAGMNWGAEVKLEEGLRRTVAFSSELLAVSEQTL